MRELMKQETAASSWCGGEREGVTVRAHTDAVYRPECGGSMCTFVSYHGTGVVKPSLVSLEVPLQRVVQLVRVFVVL